MIDPELAEAYRARYQDPAHLALLEHALAWDQTLHETPEGHSEASCTGYRMAMEWALTILVRE